MQNVKLHLGNRAIGVRWLLPILLGLLFTFGDTVASNQGRLAIDAVSFGANFVFFSLIFLILFAGAEKAFSAVADKKLSSDTGFMRYQISRLDYFIFNKHENTASFVIGIAISLCWIPWLVLFHPGIYWSDTSQQLLEHFGLAPLSDHHPFPMTLLLGWFADFGSAAFGSVSKGLFILIVVQCTIAITFFAKMIKLLRQNLKNFYAPLILFCFVALFPFVPLMFCSLAKDTISCAFFLGYIYQIIKVVIRHGDELSDRKAMGWMLLYAIAASITKKTTGYIVIITYLVLTITYRSKVKVFQTLINLAIFVMLVFWVYPSILLPAFSVEPGGKQEAIATLIQQVAHDVKYNSDTLSQEDLNTINDFLLVNTDEIPTSFDWQIVDPIKRRGLNNENRMQDFIKLWAKNTIKHPWGHLEAWLGLVDGWISFRTDLQGTPNFMVVLTYSGWHDDGIEQCTDWNDQITSGGKSAETIYRALQSIPVLNLLFYRSTWATIVPFLLLFLALGNTKGRHLERVALVTPILASLIPLVITPVSIMGGEPTRYIFAIACASPFLLFALQASERNLASS